MFFFASSRDWNSSEDFNLQNSSHSDSLTDGYSPSGDLFIFMKSVSGLCLKFLQHLPMVRRLARRNASSASSGTLNDCFSSAYRVSRSACVTSDHCERVIGTRVWAMTPQLVLHFFKVFSGSGIPVTESTLSTTQVPAGLAEGFLARRCDCAEEVITVPEGEGSEGSI